MNDDEYENGRDNGDGHVNGLGNNVVRQAVDALPDEGQQLALMRRAPAREREIAAWNPGDRQETDHHTMRTFFTAACMEMGWDAARSLETLQCAVSSPLRLSQAAVVFMYVAQSAGHEGALNPDDLSETTAPWRGMQQEASMSVLLGRNTWQKEAKVLRDQIPVPSSASRADFAQRLDRLREKAGLPALPLLHQLPVHALARLQSSLGVALLYMQKHPPVSTLVKAWPQLPQKWKTREAFLEWNEQWHAVQGSRDEMARLVLQQQKWQRSCDWLDSMYAGCAHMRTSPAQASMAALDWIRHCCAHGAPAQKAGRLPQHEAEPHAGLADKAAASCPPSLGNNSMPNVMNAQNAQSSPAQDMMKKRAGAPSRTA